MVTRKCVQMINLTRMKFLEAFEIQTKYSNQLLKGHPDARNVLLIVQHDPVYTIGIRTREYTELDEQKLKNLGAEFYRTNRGGLITFHGPGQLVAYPIINLKDFHPSMKWYICALQKTMIKTCGHFGLNAITTENTGVWIGDNKIGAIGVHGSRYVTTHGISLNCNVDLSWFEQIVPCGIEDKGVTSFSKELNRDVSVTEVTDPFCQAFQEEFQCDILSKDELYTDK